jgi:hypothetical protein
LDGPTLAHVAENLLWRKYHVVSEVCFLSDISIDLCEDFAIAAGEYLWADQGWPNWSELVKCFGEKELATRILGKLEDATGQVIADSVSQDVIASFFGGNVTAFLRGDENQLALAIHDPSQQSPIQ